MTELAALLTAIGGLVSALTGLGAFIWGTVRRAQRERPVAEAGARKFAESLARAAEDGELTPQEITDALRHLTDQAQDGEEP